MTSRSTNQTTSYSGDKRSPVGAAKRVYAAPRIVSLDLSATKVKCTKVDVAFETGNNTCDNSSKKAIS